MGSLQRNLQIQNLQKQAIKQAINRGIQQQAAMKHAQNIQINRTGQLQPRKPMKIGNLASYVNSSSSSAYQPGQVYQYTDEGYMTVGYNQVTTSQVTTNQVTTAGTTIDVPSYDIEALKRLIKDQKMAADMVILNGIDIRLDEDITEAHLKQKTEKKVNDIFNDLKNLVEGKPLAGRKFKKFAKKAFA